MKGVFFLFEENRYPDTPSLHCLKSEQTIGPHK